MMDVSRFVICDPWRALALAVIRRAVADVLGEDRIAGDDVPPEVRREEALAFLRGAAAGGPEAVWFELAEVGPEEVLEVVRRKEKARSAAVPRAGAGGTKPGGKTANYRGVVTV